MSREHDDGPDSLERPEKRKTCLLPRQKEQRGPNPRRRGANSAGILDLAFGGGRLQNKLEERGVSWGGEDRSPTKIRSIKKDIPEFER